MTTFRWYVVGLLVLFGAYVALEYYKPKPLDWTPTLSSKDKIPYGTYALFDVLPQVLGSDSVASVRLPIFNQLLGGDEPELEASRAENVDYKNDSTDRANDLAAARLEANQLPLTRERATYVFVSRDFSSSALETDALLRFLHAGNNVFIAAEGFYGRGTTLADSLGFELVEADTSLTTQVRRRSGLKTAADSVRLHFLAAQAGAVPVAVTLPASAASYRVQLTSHAPHRGATLAADAQGRPVLVRLDVGRGHLYVCAVPLALGNYWLLKPRQGEFALAALSQLPTGRPVWWDEYQKQGRAGEQTLLRVVMAHPALKTAYYLLLLAGLLFVLVEARRRQRVIPTLRPLPNTTLLFTRTVADLYRQVRGGHQQIAEKKVGLFLDYLRTRFQEPSPDLASDSFKERLSEKAGLPRPRIDELVRYINFARTAPAMTDRELLILSRAIQDFKRESQ